MRPLNRTLREIDRGYLIDLCGEEYMRNKIVDWDTVSCSLRCTVRDIK